MSLLKLLGDIEPFNFSPNTESIRYFVLVFPLLPATATTLARSVARTCFASLPSAARVSGTMSSRMPLGTFSGTRETIAAIAPPAAATSRNSCASNLSPFNATNRESGFRSRVSVQTVLTKTASFGSASVDLPAIARRTSWSERGFMCQVAWASRPCLTHVGSSIQFFFCRTRIASSTSSKCRFSVPMIW